jgi:DNA-directed RNA polymerase specialized sigma24 family protein
VIGDKRVGAFALPMEENENERLAEAYRTLLARLDPDPQRAAEEFHKLRKIAIRIAHGRCSDPENVAGEAIDRMVRRMAEGEEINNLRGYLYTVTLNVLQETWREERRFTPELPEWLEEVGWQIEDRMTRLITVRDCLKKISRKDRILIEQYYESSDRKEMAREMECTENALRLRAFHIREKLERCARRTIGKRAEVK